MNNDQPSGHLQPLDYGRPPTLKTRRVFILLGGVIAILLLASLLIPSIGRNREPANRAKCAANLRNIGQAVLHYSNRFQGRYPDTLGDLLLSGDIESGALVCPSTNDMQAVGPTTQALLNNLATAGYCSYIYLGKGLMANNVRTSTIVAYEPLANHNGAGMNVLFGDGHVEFVAGLQVQRILKQVTPLTLPTTSPVQQPRTGQ